MRILLGLVMAIIGLAIVAGLVATACDADELQTDRGRASAGAISGAIVLRDREQLIYSCDESERILSRSSDNAEIDDWLLLADICNMALDGNWSGASSKLREVRQAD